MWPDEPQRTVSHESIYTWIYAMPKGELRKDLIACLRRAKSKRMPRSRGEDRRGQMPDLLSIHVRPPEASDRAFPGHWEGDQIKGSGNRSAVGVLLERSSRLVMLIKLADATAASALEGFTAKLRSIAEPMRQTLTYDQGKEMVRHAELTANTGVMVYFCDPHSPWQRGSCENTNGLIRQFLPKGTDLSVHSQEQLDAIADLLNNRPRAIHGFNPPIVVYQAMLDKLNQHEHQPARHDRPEVPGAGPARWHRQPLPLRADSVTTCSATLTAMPLVGELTVRADQGVIDQHQGGLILLLSRQKSHEIRRIRPFYTCSKRLAPSVKN